ncbi:MAG: hypothetical protein OEV91_01955, partial [Desulfobulbaceae bacterium]|nr:hypothetical protein [Desulfobulbaceae bacterium]
PKERQGERRRNAPLLPDGAKEVRTMIGKANQNLEQQGVPVRLVLIREEEGYAIDVYDCQDDSACRTIGDLLIDLDDLPTLLRNLDREAGILVDIIS